METVGNDEGGENNGEKKHVEELAEARGAGGDVIRKNKIWSQKLPERSGIKCGSLGGIRYHARFRLAQKTWTFQKKVASQNPILHKQNYRALYLS